ncbi:MAG: SDR family NAD(P)-dependent oxidoreductase [Promethearchaeota archaeon]|nr:MAG: SDR family NAD(P)-dependent oxidoreductase [Candidatus Lokiarchaeota archaeon]
MKNILVTGASSGIGRTITEFLRNNEFHVLATARKSEDIADLDALESVTGIRMDVTKLEDINAFIKWLELHNQELFGVVNNAGVLDLGPIYDYSIEQFNSVVDVNLYGMMRVTHAVLPYLKRVKGRIVIISSMSGILSGKWGGTYVITKHAVEAYGDTLQKDLEEFGIYTSLIEPGNYKSKICANNLSRLKNEQQTLGSNAPNKTRMALISKLERIVFEEEQHPEPIDVAKAVYDAFTNEYPLHRYMVGPPSETDLVINGMFEELFQLNEYPEGKLNRDQLVERLVTLWDIKYKKY